MQRFLSDILGFLLCFGQIELKPTFVYKMTVYLPLQEIQKIVVFEGAFDKIFSIIAEEGYSD
jgi:hypothetical protein